MASIIAFEDACRKAFDNVDLTTHESRLRFLNKLEGVQAIKTLALFHVDPSALKLQELQNVFTSLYLCEGDTSPRLI
jgi:uncharacterized protein YPO0396